MDVLRGFRRRPLRSSLLLLQVFFGTLVTTLALCAAFGSRTPERPPERFTLVAGYETENESGSYSVFTSRDLPELLELAPDVERLAVFGEMYETPVVVGDTRYSLRAGAQVSAGYFGIEPLEIARGNTFTAAEAEGNEKVALLSENAARAMFGDADPVGKSFGLETDDYNPDTPPEPPTSYRVVGTFDLSLTGADPFSNAPALYLPFPDASDPERRDEPEQPAHQHDRPERDKRRQRFKRKTGAAEQGRVPRRASQNGNQERRAEHP